MTDEEIEKAREVVDQLRRYQQTSPIVDAQILLPKALYEIERLKVELAQRDEAIRSLTAAAKRTT